jgi:hypothetical protein
MERIVPPKPRCKVVIPGVGQCELDANGHTIHRHGSSTWNGFFRGEDDEHQEKAS